MRLHLRCCGHPTASVAPPAAAHGSRVHAAAPAVLRPPASCLLLTRLLLRAAAAARAMQGMLGARSRRVRPSHAWPGGCRRVMAEAGRRSHRRMNQRRHPLQTPSSCCAGMLTAAASWCTQTGRASPARPAAAALPRHHLRGPQLLRHHHCSWRAADSRWGAAASRHAALSRLRPRLVAAFCWQLLGGCRHVCQAALSRLPPRPVVSGWRLAGKLTGASSAALLLTPAGEHTLLLLLLLPLSLQVRYGAVQSNTTACVRQS